MHQLNDTIRFDVSSKGPLSGIRSLLIPDKGPCSKRRILMCRLVSEWNLLMISTHLLPTSFKILKSLNSAIK